MPRKFFEETVDYWKERIDLEKFLLWREVRVLNEINEQSPGTHSVGTTPYCSSQSDVSCD